MDQPMLQYDVAYPDHLSRGLIFIKWLLVLPHLIVLALLGIVLSVVTVIAWFAILFTGAYPRGMWEFAMKALQWGARVTAYAYLQRDEYPPFSEEVYPVLFQIAYPDHLSRGLIFIKWLLVIPHLIFLYVLQALAGIALFISWFAILLTGAFPRGMFDFVTGVSRWSNRVAVYQLLLTDAYPPFSMGYDSGPTSVAPAAVDVHQRNF